MKPITPIYSKHDGERWIFGLSEEDFARVQAGYACENCLEPFTMWVASCPVCKHENRHDVVPLPREWVRQGD